MLSLIISAFDHHDITKIHVREAMNSLVVPDEIIVVNDGGTPDLKEKLQQLEKKTKLIYANILPPKIEWNYNGAVNLGVWLSRGDILAIEDNDNIPTKEFYKQALEALSTYPTVGRIIAYQRFDISSEDIQKPSSEWKMTGKRGPNQGTYLLRREIYTALKGQDEQFCGRYGYMYHDWKRRMLLVTNFGQAGYFWYVTDGQSEISHRQTSTNLKLYRQNAHLSRHQSPIGILNFNYTVEEL